MAHEIIYCGMDLTSFSILSRSASVKIRAVNKMGDFLETKSLNLADLLFKALYKLHAEKKLPAAREIIGCCYSALKPLSSPFFKKYADYLLYLHAQEVEVLDFEDEAFVESYIKSNNIPLLFVNNWWMLPDRIIHAPHMGTLNIHPSKLPQYRGSLPTLWSLKNRDAATAVSFMKLGTRMDTGDVIAQYDIFLQENENAISLEKKIDAVLQKNLESTLGDYLDGKISLSSQDAALASYTAKYAPYMKIKWKKETARDITDKVNLYPYLWPLDKCYTEYKDRKIFFTKARHDKNNSALAEGDFRVKGLELHIGATEGAVIAPLFSGLPLGDSIYFLLNRQGTFL